MLSFVLRRLSRSFGAALWGAALALTLTVEPATAQVHCLVDDPTGTPLNIRAAPKTGRVTGRAANGTLLLGYAERGGWQAIAFVPAGADWIYFQPAWVFARYLACEGPLTGLPANGDEPALAPRCKVADPTGSPLNLREDPSGAKIGTLPNGFTLRAMALRHHDGGAWAKVIALGQDNALGWVYGDYLSCEG